MLKEPIAMCRHGPLLLRAYLFLPGVFVLDACQPILLHLAFPLRCGDLPTIRIQLQQDYKRRTVEVSRNDVGSITLDVDAVLEAPCRLTCSVVVLHALVYACPAPNTPRPAAAPCMSRCLASLSLDELVAQPPFPPERFIIGHNIWPS